MDIDKLEKSQAERAAAPKGVKVTVPDGSPAKLREHFDPLAVYSMGHGDLMRISGENNAKFSHGIPVEPEVTQLRVSIVFRSATLYGYDPETNEKVEYAKPKRGGGDWNREPAVTANADAIKAKDKWKKQEAKLKGHVDRMHLANQQWQEGDGNGYPTQGVDFGAPATPAGHR